MKLTAVCRLWRQVMSATPRAWSLIYLREHEDQDYYNRYLEVFFERSKLMPLHLPIPLEDSQDDDYVVSTIPWTVREDLGRIQCLTISCWHLSSLLFTGWEEAEHLYHFDDEFELILSRCSPSSTQITRPVLCFPHLETLHPTDFLLFFFDPRLLTRECFDRFISQKFPRLQDRSILQDWYPFNIFLWGSKRGLIGFI